MEIPIVIVTYNSEHVIAPCLTSLFQCSSDTPLVTLIDNHSTDGTVTLVTKNFPNVSIIRNETNVGYARALNPFLKSLDAPFCFVMNPDVEFSNDVLHKLMQCMQQDEQIGCAGPVVFDKAGNVGRAYGHFPCLSRIVFEQLFLDKLFPEIYQNRFLYNRNYNLSGKPLEVDYVNGSAMLIRMEALQQAGYFDEDFFLYCEESELAFRMNEKGFKAVIIPSARIVHHEGVSIRNMDPKEQLRMHRESMLLYFHKTMKWGKRFLVKLIYSIGDLSRSPFKDSKFYLQLAKLNWKR